MLPTILIFMDDKYKGMTVNERLWVSGLTDEYDKVVKEKNVNKATRILEKIELTKPNIDLILERHGLKPKERS